MSEPSFIRLHSPAEPIAPAKLKLFRKFRDPIIFLSQFHAVYQRISFLLPDNDQSDNLGQLRRSTEDLINFISFLSMGEYYSSRLHSLIGWTQPKEVGYKNLEDTIQNMDKRIQSERNYEEAYINNVQSNAAIAVELVIECLRFQDWKPTSLYVESAESVELSIKRL